MAPMDRYLAAVGKFLPEDTREDILRELRDHLLSLLEDRESALGRSLSESEQTDLLQAHGQPLQVAGRYRADGGSFTFGRTIIGPVLFPFYVKVLQIVLGIMLGIQGLGMVVSAFAGHRFQDGLPGMAFGVLVNFTIVTVIFLALQRREGSLGDTWITENPDKGFFPPSKRIGDAWFRTSQGIRTKAGAAFLVQAILLGVWFSVPHAGLFVVTFPGSLFLDPGPALPWVERVLVGLLSAHCLLSAFTFAFPDQAMARKVLLLCLDLTGMALLAWGLQHECWRVAAGGGDLMVKGQPIAEQLNEILHWALRIALAVQVVTLPIRAWRLFRKG